jgi:glycosyltransferase involved in cell wall biosynthesis
LGTTIFPSFIRRHHCLQSERRTGISKHGDCPSECFCSLQCYYAKTHKTPQARPESFRGKPNILYIGRLQERKKIDNLLYACAGLPEPIQPHLVIVGDGPTRATWEGLAKTVYPETEFVGAKHGSDLEKYFDDADLFVLPGSGGLAVQQAMAHGLPVIVAQGDGTQDDLVRPATPQQPGNGWIIPPDDVPALTDALRCALNDVAGLRQRGNESFRIVLQEANLENMVKVFIEAIEGIFSSTSHYIK